MQHAIVCGTGLFFARGRCGFVIMIFVSIRIVVEGQLDMKTEDRRTCPSCGNEFSGAMAFCPVCMLRKALAGGVKSGESSSEDILKPHRNRQRNALNIMNC